MRKQEEFYPGRLFYERVVRMHCLINTPFFFCPYFRLLEYHA